MKRCFVCACELTGDFKGFLCSPGCSTTYENLEVKIFDMDRGSTWVAAKTKEAAFYGMALELGYCTSKLFNSIPESIEDVLIDDFREDYPGLDPKEITPEQYEKYKYIEDIYNKDTDGDGITEVTCSFGVKLKEMLNSGRETPFFFATSEY